MSPGVYQQNLIYLIHLNLQVTPISWLCVCDYTWSCNARFSAVGYMLGAMVWPLVPWVLQLVVFAYWGASAIFLASMGDPEGSLVNSTRVESESIASTLNEATDRIPCDPGVSTCRFTECCAYLLTTSIVTSLV